MPRRTRMAPHLDTDPDDTAAARTGVPAVGATVLPAIEPEVLLARPAARIVDLRSPGEFTEDHLPGARNVPLFDDEERALVGLLYHRSSPQGAFQRGLDIVRGKVGRLVREIAAVAGLADPSGELEAIVGDLAQGGIAGLERRLAVQPVGRPEGEPPIVLSCWRGGLRSQSVVALLRRVGVDAWLLRGGYKAYRRAVRAALEGWAAPPAFVLRGMTGVGKTLVLRELERIRPGWTLDLEGAAGHRSSLLGMVGLEPVSQKRFESRLAERLRHGLVHPRIVLEGESRKVGDAILPPALWSALQGGTNVELVAPVERRIDVLIEDYLADESHRSALRRQLAEVEARTRPTLPLLELFDARADREVVALLLEHYYDPLYRHSEKGKTYAVTFDSTDPAAAATRVARWIESPAAGRPSSG